MAGVGPSIFFFVDQATTAAQTGNPGDEAFGPVPGDATTKFRVTSLHCATSSSPHPAAYAVCNGRVRLQQDDNDADLLTLVLAPDVQLLRGLPIRYFIYRGIRKDSLIDAAGHLVPGTLTNYLLNDGDSSNDQPDALGLAFRRGTKSPPAPEYKREDGDPIDTLFFETTTLKAIVVKAGDQLGSFNSAAFGFEIMVQTLWEPPTLKELRTVDMVNGNIITVSSSSIADRALRERVYGYMDPCAFYAICSDRPEGVKYKVESPASESTATGTQAIYDAILKKFNNRNRIYVDIRNENGLSYNYYDLYGNGEIKVGLDTGVLPSTYDPYADLNTTPIPYATDGWPLQIIEGSKLTPGTKKAGIQLALQSDVSPTSGERRIFFELARLYYNKRHRQKKDKIHDPAGRQGDRMPQVQRGAWTQSIVLAVPVVSDNSQAAPLAAWMRLRYLRENEPRPATAVRYVNTKDVLDNLFVIQSDLARWRNDNLSSWWLTGHLKYLTPSRNDQQIYKGVAEAGVAIDRDAINHNEARYTLYYVPVHLEAEPVNYRVTSGGNPAGTGGRIAGENSFFQKKESGEPFNGSNHLKLVKVNEFKGTSAPPGPPTLTFLTFVENPKLPNPGAAKNHDKESLCAISMSAAEYASLVTLASSSMFDPKLHPIFLQVRNRIFPRDAETATERSYQALELRLAGMNASGHYASVDVPSSGPGTVRPLSLQGDGMLFCTNDAATFEPLGVSWDHQMICTHVRHDSIKDPKFDLGHAEDAKYFARALADIKRLHKQFYGRMERMSLLGAEVIVHNKPGVPQHRRYLIEVSFSELLSGNQGGVTIADCYKQEVFPGASSLSDSDKGFQFFNLVTVPAAAATYDRYKQLNATRYVDLNCDRKLSSAQVNELLLKDYTRAELKAGAFDPTKLHVESYWDPSGKGELGQLERITLAELKNLGFGTLDWREPVRIEINRVHMWSAAAPNALPFATNNHFTATLIYNPRQTFVSTTLAHELGHAEALIREPLVGAVLWGQLETIFNGMIDVHITPITNKKNTVIRDQLANFVLKSSYPTPATISTILYNRDPTYEADLQSRAFLSKTGKGHLRGSPVAQNACLVERVVREQLQREALDEMTTKVTKTNGIPAIDVTQYFGELSYDYCFLNFDDAKLKP